MFIYIYIYKHIYIYTRLVSPKDALPLALLWPCLVHNFTPERRQAALDVFSHGSCAKIATIQ